MRQYNIRFDKTINIVLTLILVPLTTVPFFVMMAYIRDLPEWALFSMIFGIMGIALALTFYMVKKVTPKGLLTLNDDGFVVEFSERSLFTPPTFEIKISDISNFYTLHNEGNWSMCFATKVTPEKFNISSISKKEEDKASFEELLIAIATMIAEWNEAEAQPASKPLTQTALPQQGAAKTPITSISIFQRGWMKALLIITVIALVTMTLLNTVLELSDNLTLLKIMVIICLLLPIALKVIKANKKKKKTDN